MKRIFLFNIFGFMSLLWLAGGLSAQLPRLPANYPPGLYDESKVPSYTLPDPLVLLDGEKVTDTTIWKNRRRPEILILFETNVYGRTMVGRPADITFAAGSVKSELVNDSILIKKVPIYFSTREDGPRLNLEIKLPADIHGPLPVFLVPGWVREEQLLYRRGYGLVNFDPWEVEPDRADSAYHKGIRKFFAQPGQTEPAVDEWGTIGAWAWAASRAMDYLVTDPDIDAGKVCIMGLSRYGKVAMWAGAQDERFAIVFSCESGCGGAAIVRRGYGETVKAINAYAPHWFCGNFKQYDVRVDELPVDWHMLVALIAPRPVYIATAQEDYWGDPRGSFLAGKFAEPVYALFGKRGLGVEDMPAVEKPVGDFIGFHNRKGGHDLNGYDWQQFLNFADRHFGFKVTN
jgi:hypothetical protein